MTIAQPMEAARNRFFHESLDRPLQNSDWRGCVLDRDHFTNARLPEVIWHALVSVTETADVQVCGYFSGIERCQAVAGSWTDFASFMLEPQNYSPEYVVFDASGRWAILADVDVTTVAMDSELAGLVDAYLGPRDTSLLGLTLDHFSMDEIMSAGGSYIRNVLGSALALKDG